MRLKSCPQIKQHLVKCLGESNDYSSLAKGYVRGQFLVEL